MTQAVPVPPDPPAEPTLLDTLRRGDVHPFGQIPGASNAALLVAVECGETMVRAVLKPQLGEAPLRDFPEGSLAAREVAAYELADGLGLDCIPETVLRSDLGELSGSLQAFVTCDEGADPVRAFAPAALPAGWEPVFRAETSEGRDVVVAHDPGVRDLALFDLLANNADRKGSHVFFGSARPGHTPARVYGIDNGLCFHVDEKLRTVLWGFSGQEFNARERAALHAAADAEAALTDRLSPYLTPAEGEAIARRARGLGVLGAFPDLPDDRYPLPWPPL